MSAKLVMLSELVPHWVHDVVKSYEGDEWIVALKKKLQEEGSESSHHLTEYQGVLRFKGRICIGAKGEWRQAILKELHDSTLGGHSGINATYQRVKRMFYWQKMKEEVYKFVKQKIAKLISLNI